jgi:hypothetical protein
MIIMKPFVMIILIITTVTKLLVLSECMLLSVDLWYIDKMYFLS